MPDKKNIREKIYCVYSSNEQAYYFTPNQSIKLQQFDKNESNLKEKILLINWIIENRLSNWLDFLEIMQRYYFDKKEFLKGLNVF